MTNTVSQFLKSIDESRKVAIIEQLSKTDVSVDELLESENIEQFKRADILEYLDANRDKLLARVQFNENDPVRISDDFAPMAGKYGVVLARGVGGTFRVKFDDSELDIPEQHLIRDPAPATEPSFESRMVVLTADGILTEAVVCDANWTEKTIAEGMCIDILAVMPTTLTEEDLVTFRDAVDAELTEAQLAVRSEVMAAAAPCVDLLQEMYGDDWADVLLGSATIHALSEDADDVKVEADNTEPVTSDSSVFKHVNQDGDEVKIDLVDGQYIVTVTAKDGNVVENKTFNDINHANALAQSFM